MLYEYNLVSTFFFVNLAIYLVIHLPLDMLTYYQRREKESSQNASQRPPAFVRKHIMVITVTTSLYFWLLFFSIPFIDDLSLLYTFPIPIPSLLKTYLSLIGLVIVFVATLVACLGRLSRGTRAISWGIPTNLVTTGMFRFIRHPLYASYIYYFIGLSLIFQSVVVCPLLLGIYGYYYSSTYEEEILIEYFGSEYLEYQKRVGRFFPRIFTR